MRFLILILIITPCYAHDGVFYAEFGAGWPRNDYDLIEGPIGRVLLGYERDGCMVEIDHQSSIPDQNDQGIEAIWINKRIYFK